MLRCDTDFGLMCTRSVRNLLSDTHFAILLRSDTGLALMYTCSARTLLSDFRHTFLHNASLKHNFWCNLHRSLALRLTLPLPFAWPCLCPLPVLPLPFVWLCSLPGPAPAFAWLCPGSGPALCPGCCPALCLALSWLWPCPLLLVVVVVVVVVAAVVVQVVTELPIHRRNSVSK